MKWPVLYRRRLSVAMTSARWMTSVQRVMCSVGKKWNKNASAICMYGCWCKMLKQGWEAREGDGLSWALYYDRAASTGQGWPLEHRQTHDQTGYIKWGIVGHYKLQTGLANTCNVHTCLTRLFCAWFCMRTQPHVCRKFSCRAAKTQNALHTTRPENFCTNGDIKQENWSAFLSVR